MEHSGAISKKQDSSTITANSVSLTEWVSPLHAMSATEYSPHPSSDSYKQIHQVNPEERHIIKLIAWIIDKRQEESAIIIRHGRSHF